MTRRVAWLVLSPLLAVASAAVLALGVVAVLVPVLLPEDDRPPDLAGVLERTLVLGLVVLVVGAVTWCVGSSAALAVVAARTFPHRHAGRALLAALLAALPGGVVVGAATGLVDGSALPLGVLLAPTCLPLTGAVAFLLAERDLRLRRQPPTTQPWGSASRSASFGPHEPGA